MAHAPQRKGLYELVTFDENQNPKVLFVGAAFKTTIFDALQGHAEGRVSPAANALMTEHPNLYFDYIAEWDAKSEEDARDIYWWLVQKHRPPHNDPAVSHSGRFEKIHVVELD